MKLLAGYDHPLDFPTSYVARYFLIERGQVIPTNEILTAESLEKLLELIPPDLHFIPRLKDDEPHIIGVWV